MQGPVLELSYQPPFDWDWVLSFLARRLIAGVEHIEDGHYFRVLAVPGQPGRSGWLSACALSDRPAIRLCLSPTLSGQLAPVAALAARLFDLHAQPQLINPILGELAADAPGVRVPGAFDGFELAVRAVLGQQVTVKAAHTLARRLAERFGERLETSVPQSPAPPPALSRVFPPAARIAGLSVDELASCGVIRTRAGAIIALAQAIASGELQLSPEAPVPQTLRRLTAIRGIGDWTAHYVAMRALAWSDAFPAADLILMRALQVRTPAQADKVAGAWRPWRAYAVMHLWRRAGLAAAEANRRRS